jgi:CubicO group peptidase (beta-lactamase class C family)
MSAFDFGAAAAAADQAVLPWRAENGPGGAILLFDITRIRHETSGGLADLAHGLAFTPDTANRWASLTKHVFCALLLRSGIALDARLGELLDNCSPAVGEVTVGRALDMTSGLPDLGEYLAGLGLSTATTIGRTALDAAARQLPELNYPQGTEISYTNTGYRLLQTALELHGPPLLEAWREKFFRPLQLDIAYPEDFSEPVPHLAAGYWRDEAGWHVGRSGTHFSASGGLAGSGRTLARWLMALLSGAAPVGPVLDELSKRRALVSGEHTFYGLGIAHAPWLGQACFGHGGSLPGFKDHFLLAPGQGAGVAVVSNREDTDALGITLAVMAAGLGATLPPPAEGVLPDGLFADATGGPFWIESSAGRVSFLGAEERLFREGERIAVTRSPYMSMRLAREGERIVGDVNMVERRFAPVPAGIAADPAWAGEWHAPGTGASLRVEIDGSGEAVAGLGIGPGAQKMPLRPIAGGRAIGDARDGPWRRRPCFVFRGDRVRIVSNRSRVLDYVRR